MKAVARLLFCILVFSSVLTQSTWAQNWPARPIRFIVSQAAGGTPDLLCRLITERLGRALGQQIFVENRIGGGNVIGAEVAARAAPDGTRSSGRRPQRW
jgi:tripartite-type tricarboxylate transporter receptor subunit TctC